MHTGRCLLHIPCTQNDPKPRNEPEPGAWCLLLAGVMCDCQIHYTNFRMRVCVRAFGFSCEITPNIKHKDTTHNTPNAESSQLDNTKQAHSEAEVRCWVRAVGCVFIGGALSRSRNNATTHGYGYGNGINPGSVSVCYVPLVSARLR
jgi:hypothetical protein